MFSFLVGNEDMHLKNFSIIYKDDVIALSPAYDLLNTTIVLTNPAEELALPINGKKNKLKRYDLVDYFGRERLQLSERIIDNVLLQFIQSRNSWKKLVVTSFLSKDMQERYCAVLDDRFRRLYKQN